MFSKTVASFQQDVDGSLSQIDTSPMFTYICPSVWYVGSQAHMNYFLWVTYFILFLLVICNNEVEVK